MAVPTSIVQGVASSIVEGARQIHGGLRDSIGDLQLAPEPNFTDGNMKNNVTNIGFVLIVVLLAVGGLIAYLATQRDPMTEVLRQEREERRQAQRAERRQRQMQQMGGPPGQVYDPNQGYQQPSQGGIEMQAMPMYPAGAGDFGVGVSQQQQGWPAGGQVVYTEQMVSDSSWQGPAPQNAQGGQSSMGQAQAARASMDGTWQAAPVGQFY